MLEFKLVCVSLWLEYQCVLEEKKTVAQLNQQFDRDLHHQLQQPRCYLRNSLQCGIVLNDQLLSSTGCLCLL